MDLSAQADELVRGFRFGEDAQANSALVALIDALAGALTRPPLSAHSARIFPILQQILDAQQRSDTLWIADLVAYELSPILAASKG